MPSGDYDPVAMTSPPSAWACKNEDSLGRQIQVTDSTTSPDVGPAPDFGPNYLRVSRVNADLSDPMPGYLEAEAQYVPAADGDHLHFAYWINSARPVDCTEINLWQNTGALAFQLIVDYQGAWVWYNGQNAGFDNVFKDRVWQKCGDRLRQRSRYYRHIHRRRNQYTFCRGMEPGLDRFFARRSLCGRCAVRGRGESGSRAGERCGFVVGFDYLVGLRLA